MDAVLTRRNDCLKLSSIPGLPRRLAGLRDSAWGSTGATTGILSVNFWRPSRGRKFQGCRRPEASTTLEHWCIGAVTLVPGSALLFWESVYFMISEKALSWPAKLQDCFCSHFSTSWVPRVFTCFKCLMAITCSPRRSVISNVIFFLSRYVPLMLRGFGSLWNCWKGLGWLFSVGEYFVYEKLTLCSFDCSYRCVSVKESVRVWCFHAHVFCRNDGAWALDISVLVYRYRNV